MGDPDTPRAIHEAATAGLPPAETDSGIPVAPLYGPPEDDPRLGYPGQPPFTRGVYPSMYRGRPWTIRLYAGWGSPEDTNGRFRYLLERGQTGLSVALDLPTQMGLDPDHPLALGEVGKVGVSVATLADMETIFDRIPLERVSTSFTINATASVVLAMYIAVGRRQGVSAADLRGTVQNDILKEYLARKTYIFPPGPSLRLAADVLEWSAREAPKFNAISVCGYHIRQAGSDAVQEVAIALSNGLAYLQAVVDRGVDIDVIAPRFSFNISTMRDFFEEIAKHRAARRIWSDAVQERFGAKDPRSMQLRLFSGGDGTTLTAVEPMNNVVRIAYQALAIVLSGAQAVHTMGYDEALGLPTEEAALIALRTQQILAHEIGMTRTVNPLGGSYYLEALTDEIERRAREAMAEIERNGGVTAGIEDGSLERAVADAAYREQQAIERGEREVVGVNVHVDPETSAESMVPVHGVPEEVAAHQVERLARVRAERDEGVLEAALARLQEEARGQANLMPAIVEAVEAYGSIGEICDRLAAVFGRHAPLQGGLTVEPPLLRGRLDHVGVAAAGEHPLEGLVAGEPTRRLMPSGVEITRRGGVELVRPGTPDSPIAGFLARRGDGLHHVALAVDEPLGAVVTRLEAAGVRVIGPIVPSSDGRPSVFLHPSTMGGVLVELVEGPAG